MRMLSFILTILFVLEPCVAASVRVRALSREFWTDQHGLAVVGVLSDIAPRAGSTSEATATLRVERSIHGSLQPDHVYPVSLRLNGIVASEFPPRPGRYVLILNGEAGPHSIVWGDRFMFMPNEAPACLVEDAPELPAVVARYVEIAMMTQDGDKIVALEQEIDHGTIPLETVLNGYWEIVRANLDAPDVVRPILPIVARIRDDAKVAPMRRLQADSIVAQLDPPYAWSPERAQFLYQLSKTRDLTESEFRRIRQEHDGVAQAKAREEQRAAHEAAEAARKQPR